MADSQILALRKAIVKRLQEKLPGVNVEEHRRAKFDPRDFDRCLKDRALALRVAFVGTPEDVQLSSNDVDAPEAWAIYIAAKDVADEQRTIHRDETIFEVLPTILRTVCSNGWDVGDIEMSKPMKVRSAELDGGEAETSAKSTMLWGVSWLQVACIPPEQDGDIRPFLTLITKYDLTPNEDSVPEDRTFEAEDTITLPQG